MEIKSLDNLERNGVIFELYAEVIDKDTKIGIYKFPCTDKHNMRMDLVCNDIYTNTDSIDILCAINGIYNPLVVQNGDVIYFVNPDDLTTVRSSSAIIQNIINTVTNANAGKTQKTDDNKTNDNINKKNVESNKTYIPPNILQTQNTNVDYGEGVILLRPNF